MAFQAFLEQQRTAPRRRRAHLGSALMHAAILGLLLMAARESSGPDPIAVDRAPLLVAAVLMQPGSSPTGVRPVVAASLSAAAGRPRAVPRRRRPDSASAVSPPIPGDADTPASPAVDGPPGVAAGGDEEEPSGGGPGRPGAAATANDGGRSRRRPELFARIVGSGIRPGTAVRTDLPFISLKEATTLRTADFFPRLPAALWTDRGPYLVALEVCVSEDGRVSEASLRSHASARLDPMVLAAVRGWRYRPRLLAGRATGFCHGVLIRYERTY